MIREQDNNLYVCLGFIQGDGDLGRIKTTTHRGMEVNIGKDDDDVLDIFSLESEKLKKDRTRKYYIRGYNGICNKLEFSPESLPERVFPSTFDSWEYNDKISFIRGMYSANGTALKGYGRVSYKGTCYNLIVKLKQYLESLGLTPNITTNKPKEVEFSNGTYLCKESYDLNINKLKDRKWFYEHIGFVQDYKNKKLLDSFTPFDTSTGVKGVRRTHSKKYKISLHTKDKNHSLGTFKNFDNAVKHRLQGEAEYFKEFSPNFIPATNTLQLSYVSHDDKLITFIECDLQGNITQFIKPNIV